MFVAQAIPPPSEQLTENAMMSPTYTNPYYGQPTYNPSPQAIPSYWDPTGQYNLPIHYNTPYSDYNNTFEYYMQQLMQASQNLPPVSDPNAGGGTSDPANTAPPPTGTTGGTNNTWSDRRAEREARRAARRAEREARRAERNQNNTTGYRHRPNLLFICSLWS